MAGFKIYLKGNRMKNGLYEFENDIWLFKVK